MKFKKTLLVILFFFILTATCPAVAKCYTNEEKIPCDIFWSQYGWIFVIAFLILGLLFLIKPNWILKWQAWSSEKLMGARYIPSKKTEISVRLIGILFVVFAIFFVSTMIYLATIKKTNSITMSVPKSIDEKFEWKNFSDSNGGVLSFKYPNKICWNGTDCRNLYVMQVYDTIYIGQTQQENSNQIEDVFTIYYSNQLFNQNKAEEYLEIKYGSLEPIFWIADINNPDVKVAELHGNKLYKTYAAYSSKLGMLVSFTLPPACLLDCKVDNDILNSIKLDGVRVYYE